MDDPAKPILVVGATGRHGGTGRIVADMAARSSPTRSISSKPARAALRAPPSRFAKRVHVPLREIRAFAGDGLFTAYNDEPNWALAHTILMPAFGPLGVRAMFEDMVDIADQMFARWARFGPDAVIDVADNMTRLTLDTIALTAFNYRFNSFYREDMHPFVDAMVGALAESGARARRFKPVTDVMLLSNRRYRSDIDIMQQVARDLIARRKASPTAGSETDLLGRMLNGRDPRTGEGLSDKNIVHQMITFLIAGHETTSGLLSFVTYFLLKNPAVLAEARRQVDAVVGTGLPTLGHLAELRYLEQILMETLRLWPTAPLFGRYPFEDTVVGGKYRLTPDDTVLVLLPEVQRDPAVWGADAGAFRPERHTPENAERLPEHAWKPFGTGARACIGRPFAMQEAHLVLTMMLQRFEFAFEDPSYTLKVHETLTLKPENLRIRAWLRGEAKAAAASPAGANSADHAPSFEMASRDHVDLSPDAPKIHVLYGSNTGSAEAFANRLFAQAAGRGFAATLGALDEFVGNVPAAGTIVVVTASYEGQPPDNAVQFVPFIETLDPGSLAGREFAIFGCGNRQWARTWQAIPRRIEAALVAAGGQELLPRGEGDSGGDFFGAFDAWAEQFWAALADSHGMEGATANAARGLKLEWLPDERLALLRIGDLAPGKVVENRELTATGAANARSKRHIEFELPANQTYETGDYLAVLAVNPPERVAKALRLFGLSGGRAVVLHAPHQEAAGLPTGRPVRCDEILSSYVELGQPATRQAAGPGGSPLDARSCAAPSMVGLPAAEAYRASRTATRQVGTYSATHAQRPAMIEVKASSSPDWASSVAKWQAELRAVGLIRCGVRLVGPSVGGDLLGRRSRCLEGGPVLVAHGCGRNRPRMAVLLVRFHGFSIRFRNVLRHIAMPVRPMMIRTCV